jgi:hypothetical protein
MGYGVSSSMALALAGFCCSVIFIAFVCSRLACALLLRRRRGSRRAAPDLPQYAVSHSSSSSSYPVHVARHSAGGAGAGGGLDPAAVAAFPTRAATPRASSDADSQ